MACKGFQHPFRTLIRDLKIKDDVPKFLAPAAVQGSFTRSFTTSPTSKSRIGVAPISIPPEVSLRFFDLPKSNTGSRKIDASTSAVEIKGPLGQITLNLPQYLFTNYDENDRRVTIKVGDPTIKHQRAMWGTMRAHFQNIIAGVSEGHVCILRMVGVGFRATIENSAITKKPEYPGQKFVSLKLGYAHPVELPVPLGVTATVPLPTKILLEGPDKQVVTQFAAEIRGWKKPEPYKGKGIFINDETIRMKAKKIK